MTIYEEKRLYSRYGKNADKGTTPPDKSILFYAIDTGKIYGVNDLMQWVELNPDFPTPPGQYHVFHRAMSTALFPSTVLFPVNSFGAFITKIDVQIEEPYDDGLVMTIGDNADVDRMFEATEIDPTTVGTYTVFPNYQYNPGSELRVYLSFDATTGSGTIFVHYDEAPTH